MDISSAEPVAVVGMGCRLPGEADSPEQLWSLLLAGVDATSEIPPQRWAQYEADPVDSRALRGVTRRGGFLSDAAGFDAEFFGVTPREAELMDPQQRIILEVTWHALEDAGIAPERLAGTSTGVFVGVGSDDYGRQMLEDLPRIEAWTGIGASMCAVANRVSYVLDLRGPSMAVDTACSGSLVAIHLACQSLRTGESEVAIAGGINLIAGPGLTMVLDSAGATSPDGRSKSFDASADGYGRGEGCGVLVLKRLADALRDGDPIAGVIRGSAVSQDGRTNGIMAPNPDAQELVVRQALRQAGVPAASVGYVEAHGTGTRMGDPIEAAALSAVYGRDRAGRPCAIGSIKANIGHLEAGAGVAGAIKALLALRHAVLPPNINLTEPSPAIPWDENGLAVVREATTWPAGEAPRRAAVSSFGYGGTVAHVVLEQAPDVVAAPPAGSTEPAPALEPAPVLVAVSGATDAGRAAAAVRLAEWLDGAGRSVALRDIAHTTLLRRGQARSRGVVVGADHTAVAEGLRTIAGGDESDAVVLGETLPAAGERPVWVFSGHGSQWIGMGRELLDESPVFAAVIDSLGEIYAAEIGFVPRDVLVEGDLRDVDRIQPMIFAMQVALAAVWRSHGVEPAAVIGHSVGEIAAAVVAGVLGLDAGARLICRRSALLSRVAGKGAMAMVALPFEETAQRLAGRPDVVAAIAASPESTVISGDPAAVDEVAGQWESQAIVVRRVASDVAFHSPQMDELLPDLRAALADLEPVAGSIPVYSTASTDPRSRTARDAGYWAANLREPVRFAQAVAAAAEDGHRFFLEISSHPVVTHSITETLAAQHVAGACVTGTLRRNRPEVATLLGNLAVLHTHGARIDWTPATAGGSLAALPPVAWQHRDFWREPTRRSGGTGQHDESSHTLLGGRTTVAGSTTTIWQTYLDHDTRPYPGSHPIHGVEIIPAAVLLNTFLAGTGAAVLSDVNLRVPVSVAVPREIQVVREDSSIRLASRLSGEHPGVDAGWLTHTTAIVGGPADLPEHAHPDALWGACVRDLDPASVGKRLKEVGVAAVGFDWEVVEFAGADDLLVAELAVDRAAPAGWASAFDAVLSIAPLLFDGEPVLRMPSGVDRLTIRQPCPASVLVAARRSGESPDAETAEILVTSLDGEVLARFDRLRFGRIDGGAATEAAPRQLIFHTRWRELPDAGSPDAGSPDLATPLVLVGDPGPLADTLLTGARAAGAAAELIGPDDVPAWLDRASGPMTLLVLPPRRAEADPAAGRAAWRLARTVQAVAGHTGAAAGSVVRALTQGVREATGSRSLDDSAIWGLGRVLTGEHPDVWGGVLDVGPDPSGTDVRVLLSHLSRPGAEPIVVLRGTTAEAPRLVPVDEAPEGDSLTCQADGTYLITGGLGVLGLETAAWLAQRGARRIVLAGRTGLPPRAEWDDVTDPVVRRRIDAVRALETRGVTVRAVAVDIADLAAARAALDPDRLGLTPIRGVVHAAGVLDNRLVGDLDEESLRTVLRPKVAGALVLDRLFPAGTLDFLALFSSNGQLLNLTGQASYAAANSVLDALARRRSALGGTDTLSLAWTSWRGLGMAVNDVVDQELADRGVTSISAGEAYGAWELAAQFADPNVVVMRLIAPPAGVAPLPLLSELTFDVAQDDDPAADAGADDWAGIDADELPAWLCGEVAEQVGAELRVPGSAIDGRRPLVDLGLDSVMTLVIRRRLERRFRLSLPATLLWNHPTVSAVAEYLAGRLAGTQAAATEPIAVDA